MRRNRLTFAVFCILAAAGAFAGEKPPAKGENEGYHFDTFQFPDAPRQVAGVKYRAGDARAAVPLGGLGTGTVALDSRGQFTRQAIANSYRPVGGVMPGCGFTIRTETEGRFVEQPLSKLVQSYLGHFPMIDIEGAHAEMPIILRLRAMSPFILGDARASATPAAMFRFSVENQSDKPVKAAITFHWDAPVAAGLAKPGEVIPRRTQREDGTNAIAVTRGEPGDHAGCTIAALKLPGVKAGCPPTPTGKPSPEVISVVAAAGLPPHGRQEFRFVLAWYYPQARNSKGEFVGHQYANWFDGSLSVAKSVISRWDDLARRTGQWQEQIYDDPKLPGWLKDQLVNSLYPLARNTSWLKDGRFSQSETFINCPITETIVCRFYGSTPLAMFFPDLEKNTMRQFIRWQRPDGAIPFAFGGGENWDAPVYAEQKILNSSEFVLMAWRDYAWWKDKAWADEVYPAVKKAVAYARSLDTDGDGLINDELSKQYYDQWQFYGSSAYTSGIWLAAIKAAGAFAGLQGDIAFHDECDAMFTKAQASFEQKLWTGSYYRLWNDTAQNRRSDTCLAAQLTGQWFAYSCGLGEVLPRRHVFAALEHVHRVNAAGRVWALVNGITPDGSRDKTDGLHGHSDTATLGETWCYAATCTYAGCPGLGLPVAARLADNISLRQRSPWNTYWNIDPNTGQMRWGSEYDSNMCVWDLWGALTERRRLEP